MFASSTVCVGVAARSSKTKSKNKPCWIDWILRYAIKARPLEVRENVVLRSCNLYVFRTIPIGSSVSKDSEINTEVMVHFSLICCVKTLDFDSAVVENCMAKEVSKRVKDCTDLRPNAHTYSIIGQWILLRTHYFLSLRVHYGTILS